MTSEYFSTRRQDVVTLQGSVWNFLANVLVVGGTSVWPVKKNVVKCSFAGQACTSIYPHHHLSRLYLEMFISIKGGRKKTEPGDGPLGSRGMMWESLCVFPSPYFKSLALKWMLHCFYVFFTQLFNVFFFLFLILYCPLLICEMAVMGVLQDSIVNPKQSVLMVRMSSF